VDANLDITKTTDSMITAQKKARWGVSLSNPAILLSLVIVAAGCSKEVVGNKGEPVRDGEAPLAVTVQDASLRRITLETETGPLIFDTPVLALTVKFENVGETEQFYQPRHTTDKAVDIQEPLLFVKGAEGQPPTVNITSVRLNGGLLPEQQAQGVKIKPGSSITDTYLFTAPAEEKVAFVFTVPPQLHGGKKKLVINIPYERNDVPEDPVGKLGEAVEIEGLKLTVTGAETAWVELSHESKGKGYSGEPVYKVNYTLENAGEGEVRCSPNHGNSGSAVLAPSLKEVGGQSLYSRVRFGGSTTVVGQVQGDVAIGAGKKISDFAVFDRPPAGVKNVMFVFPGALCGTRGIARVQVPYKHDSPPKPKEGGE